MGHDKALLTHPSGISFLNHATTRASEVCDDVCLSASHPYESVYRTLEDPLAFQGPITGIVTALAIAQRESFGACLITPVDMPLLSTEDLCKLKDVWYRSPDRLVCAISASEHRIQPLVAIYPTNLTERLTGLANSDDRSLRRWIKDMDHDEVSLPAAACHNINAPEDLSLE